MALPVEMPKMSDTMTEGVLVTWLAEEGQKVTAGDVIAQVETDKATMDLEVYDDGVLLKRVIEEGDAVPIGGLIAVLGKQGEDISEILSRYEGGLSEPTAAEPAEIPVDAVTETVTETVTESATAVTPTAPSDGRIKASPLARRLAGEHGIEIASIAGSGPEGRVVKRDVEAAVASPRSTVTTAPLPASAPLPDGGYEAIRISQMRKTVARRLAESKFSAPHFYLTLDIDMSRAIEAREHMNARTEAQGGPKISFNDLVTKACAVALRQHPHVNSSWMEKEGEIRRHADIHVAIAVAVDEGLITPVIRHADRKGLAEIAVETRALAERARAKELQPEEYLGSTFSTSNLGMFGIEEFTAIINPPNACILAIGAIRNIPVVEGGAVVPGARMKVTLSCDHRVVDGATGARFLSTVRDLLEEPVGMLL